MAHDGWDFINERGRDNPKKGYVATRPGSKLLLKVNTTRGKVHNPFIRASLQHKLAIDGGHTSYLPVPVSLAYLKSYVHMGTAVVR